MSESVSYWVCACGTANDKSLARCKSCEARRPLWRWLPWAGGLIVVLVAVLFLLPEDPAEGSNLPSDQIAFRSLIDTMAEAAGDAANDVARKAIVLRRDRQVAEQFAGPVTGWRGRVEGVSQMEEGVGIAVSVGRARLLAGVHVMQGRNTLISPEGALYPVLLDLSRGDLVVISGAFDIAGGEAVEISFGEDDAAREPEFLFRFESIEKIAP